MARGNIHVASGGVVYFERSNNYTYNRVISGAGYVYQEGTGTLTLGGDNTYTGRTLIRKGGTLRLTGSIENSSEVNIINGKFEISDDDKIIKALRSEVTTSEVILGSNYLIIGTNRDSNDGGGIFNGRITGTGGIHKTGKQTLTLNGVNSYTGDTGIMAGVLKLGVNGKIETSNTVVLHFSGKFDIIDDGKLIKRLNSSSNTTEVILGSNYLVIGLSVDSSDGGGSFNGKISGSGGITKNGSQTLTLNGENTYTGLTDLFSGKLILGENGLISNSSGIKFSTNIANTKLEISQGRKYIKSLNSTYAASEVILTATNSILYIGSTFTSGDGSG
jgi:autotransporter-associated beta strand protein